MKEKLIEFVSTHDQFSNESMLWRDIKSTISCSDKQAKNVALKHCNCLSTYSLLYCQGLTDLSYPQFYRWGLNCKAIDMYGYFNVDKEDIFKMLNIKLNLVSTPFGVNYHEGFYQLKITNSSGSDHFIACYSNGGIIYLVDSGSRGVGISLETGLKDGDKKLWLKQYEVAA